MEGDRDSRHCEEILKKYHQMHNKKKYFNYLGFPSQGNHPSLYQNEDSGYVNPEVGVPLQKHFAYSEGYKHGNRFARHYIDKFVTTYKKTQQPITLIIGHKGSYVEHGKKFIIVGCERDQYIILQAINS